MSEGREVGDEGVESGDRRDGKWGSSNPLSNPTDLVYTVCLHDQLY